jgi:Cytochrome c7 and related cytochrome c
MNNAQDKKTRGSSKASGETSPSMSRRGWLVVVLVVAGFGALGTLWVSVAKGMLDSQDSSSAAGAPAASTSGQVSPVFTTARQSFFSAVKEYFEVQGTPVQPIQFNHSIHIKNGLQCEGCHTGVTQGPDAGIPSVTFCMACHQAIATDKPEIKKLAAYAAKGQEPPWQPVFWFYPASHVHFQHAPHIRNGIACEECHGDLSKETVAVRSKNLTMDFCLSCHKAKGVSVDCVTCHY